MRAEIIILAFLCVAILTQQWVIRKLRAEADEWAVATKDLIDVLAENNPKVKEAFEALEGGNEQNKG